MTSYLCLGSICKQLPFIPLPITQALNTLEMILFKLHLRELQSWILMCAGDICCSLISFHWLRSTCGCCVSTSSLLTDSRAYLPTEFSGSSPRSNPTLCCEQSGTTSQNVEMDASRELLLTKSTLSSMCLLTKRTLLTKGQFVCKTSLSQYRNLMYYCKVH